MCVFDTKQVNVECVFIFFLFPHCIYSENICLLQMKTKLCKAAAGKLNNEPKPTTKRRQAPRRAEEMLIILCRFGTAGYAVLKLIYYSFLIMNLYRCVRCGSSSDRIFQQVSHTKGQLKSFSTFEQKVFFHALIFHFMIFTMMVYHRSPLKSIKSCLWSITVINWHLSLIFFIIQSFVIKKYLETCHCIMLLFQWNKVQMKVNSLITSNPFLDDFIH